ncbi:hypothetical protein SIN09_29260, partial [Streptomyces sp. F8]|uniref:hypothetical protein n=1 Tax=Streptomyces sp. F8 TaxID=1436085 RepID=UPI0029CE9B4F
MPGAETLGSKPPQGFTFEWGQPTLHSGIEAGEIRWKTSDRVGTAGKGKRESENLESAEEV